MIAVGFHEPKKLSRFEQAWKKKLMPPLTRESIADMSRRADEMWEHHEAAMKRRLPS